MKQLHYILSSSIILFFISLSPSSAQASTDWANFLEEDLNDQSNLNWSEVNGSIEASPEWLSFQSDTRVEQPIFSGTTNAHHLALDSEQEQMLSGKTVRITISAKQPSENAARSFAVAYSTNDSGNSGWRSFRTSPDWQSYSFTFKVPKLKDGNGDYLAIAGDFYGTNKATLIQTLKIEVLNLDDNETEEVYVVQTGDTLSSIAQDVYADGNLWPEIYEANIDSIENPNILQVGTELTIPLR